MSECIAMAKEYEEKLGFAPSPDEDFVQDVQAGINERCDLSEPPGMGLVLDSSVLNCGRTS